MSATHLQQRLNDLINYVSIMIPARKAKGPGVR